jgi:hypothetical protein
MAQCVGAQTGDPAAIQQALNSRFRLTAVTADRSDIVTPGDVVQIDKPGLMMYGVASPMPPSNTYKNGKIGQGWGGFGQDLAIGLASPGGATAANYPHRQFAAGEKCWVKAIQVQKDGIVFQLYSDPYDNIRYYANLKIPFPDKKEVPPVDTALQLVAEVISVVPQQNQGGNLGAAPGPGPAQQNALEAISGQYFLQATGAHLLLLPDGSFTLTTAAGMQSPGQFSVNGDRLALTYNATGRSSYFRIVGGRLVADTGVAWERVGDAPQAAVSTPAPAQAAEPAPAPMPDIAPPPRRQRSNWARP